jgi:hypothetical protein
MLKVDASLIDWLLEGDVSIQYQTYRDLLDSERNDLRARIAREGWGAQFLTQRNEDGHWGQHYYQPKWTSTHYTLLDLKNLGISPDNFVIRDTIALVLETNKADDGGIHPNSATRLSDLCIDGMFLNVASYFGAEEEQLKSIVDLLIESQMADGGFNCRLNRGGAVHSSMHTTISVLEGLHEYLVNGYSYRRNDMARMVNGSCQLLLMHHLFKSDRTGEVIDKRFLMLSFPSRWRYDILRALDTFRSMGVPYDPRMQPALDVLHNKRLKNGTWPVQARIRGKRTSRWRKREDRAGGIRYEH